MNENTKYLNILSKYHYNSKLFFKFVPHPFFIYDKILKNAMKHINILKNEIDRAGSRSVDLSSIDLFFHDFYPIR